MTGVGAFATLSRRGLVKQTTDASSLARLLDREAVTFYLGIDPTGPSLHAGHLVGLLAMAHLQRAGHRPVLLIGGGTARVGDPSDKDDMRPLMPVETVARNAALMQRQVGRFIDLERTIQVVEESNGTIRGIKARLPSDAVPGLQLRILHAPPHTARTFTVVGRAHGMAFEEVSETEWLLKPAARP